MRCDRYQSQKCPLTLVLNKIERDTVTMNLMMTEYLTHMH